MNAELILVRHCEASGHQPDSPLTEAGAAAAQTLAHRLVALGADAAVSSPYQRAIDTIAPFADLIGRSVITDNRFAERTLSGAARTPNWQEHIRKSYEDIDYKLPGGESLRDVANRGLPALMDIATSGFARPAIATHGTWLATIITLTDPSFGFAGWQSLRNPDLFHVEINEGRVRQIERLDPME